MTKYDCDFCGSFDDVALVSDGTESGESDYVCAACRGEDDQLLFSHRKFLSSEFERWLSEPTANCPVNVIAWLDSRGLVNRRAVRKIFRQKRARRKRK